MTPSNDIIRLLDIMAALRTPETGCPWDIEQTFATIAPYTIEEAYEVADAIQRGDLPDLKDELGDLLLQVVYHARMAEEQDAFAFGDVVHAITSKMIRRHPHVFGTPEERAAGAAPGFWARIKAEEKAAKDAERATTSPSPSWGRSGGEATPTSPPPSWGRPGGGDAAASAVGIPPTPNPSPSRDEAAPSARGGGGPTPRAHANPGLLADIPVALPALTRAVKLQDKAARVGFDWSSLAPVFDKMREELSELEDVARPADPRGAAPDRSAERIAKIEEEFGDLLFVMANVARHLKLDPEAALRAANQKFMRRFAHIERRLAEDGRSPADSDLAEMDALWDEAKAIERAPG
ncbi:MazG family protein [Hyphomicrobium sp.]|uniref:nucleoside triphosphate pyrophosphohydrolase n=1 Tax=Hyphomicrobium sp. TaxID=82 RepID=UPI003F70ACE7